MDNGDCHSEVFGLADVKCRKDHAQILDHTCMPEVIKSVNLIERSQVVFSLEPVEDDNNKKMILSLSDAMFEGDKIYHAIKPVFYIAGDLSFLSYLMGKDNFSSTWCNWCRIPSSVWKTPPSTPNVDDFLWSVERVNEQVSTNKINGYSNKRRMGVRNSPKFMIPFARILFSGLHASIGISGVFIHKLEEFIDVDVEHLSAEEFQIRETKSSASIQIDLLRDDKRHWNDSVSGGRLLSKKRARSKKLVHEQSQDDNSEEDSTALQEEQKILVIEILTLEAARNIFSKQIVGLTADISKASAKLEMFTKDRRIGEESVYTQIDRIFQSHGANRSHYFGRQFQGKDIRKIMDKADELFGSDGTGGEIRVAFVSHVTAKNLSDAEKEELLDKVHKMCNDVGMGLKLWDGALADIHVNDYEKDHCRKTQDKIDKAMAHMRGIDVAYCRMGSMERAAGVRTRLERMASNHKVKTDRQRLEVKYVGSRKRKAVELKEEYNVKKEKRDKALADMYTSLATNNDEGDIIEKRLDELYEVDDAEDMNDLGMQLLGEECVNPPNHQTGG